MMNAASITSPQAVIMESSTFETLAAPAPAAGEVVSTPAVKPVKSVSTSGKPKAKAKKRAMSAGGSMTGKDFGEFDRIEEWRHV